MSNLNALIGTAESDVAPVLSAETILYHYGQHHCGYVRVLQTLIEGTEFANMDLEQIIIQSRGKHQKIFNNAAQIFNHNFYWQCLKTSSVRPTAGLKMKIEQQFSSFEDFLDKYIAFAGTLFGSGWSWLVINSDGDLEFLNTQNAETTVGTEFVPICVVDLWEHAYYIDYRHNRAEYIKSIITQCINWEMCEYEFSSVA